MISSVQFKFYLSILALTVALGTSGFAQERQKCLIVLDASNSMTGYKKGEQKMRIAKAVIGDLVATMPENIDLGLVVYAHRKKNDCEDIELLIPPGPLDANAFMQVVNGIRANGKTPLTNAVEFAANVFVDQGGTGSIILITDGLETCRRDPCEAVAALMSTGIQLTTHVVAFDLSDDQAKEIECIATMTGGLMLAADNAGDLFDALNTAITMVAAGPLDSPAPQPAAPSEPEPTPEIVEEEIVLTVLDSIPAGSKFEVTWEGPANPDDFLVIVPDWEKDSVWRNREYVKDNHPVSMTALINPQAAEVRMISAKTDKVLGRAATTITDIEATVIGPAQALQGNTIAIEWTGPAYDGDFVTIVPKDAEEGVYKAYKYAKRDTPIVKVRGIPAIGPAEIRYVTGQGKRTLARADIEFVEALVSLTAVEETIAGNEVSITWEGPANEGDFITIVPASTEEGKYLKYKYAEKDQNTVKVTAPMQTGDGEIRYIAGNGRATLARIPIAINEATVSLSAQEETVAGGNVTIQWEGPANSGDFITIVPSNTDEGKYLKYAYAEAGKNSIQVIAPMKTGAGEIRYIAGNGRATLARIPITITEAIVSLTASAEAIAGSLVNIDWEGPGNQGDFITIVPASSAEGKYQKSKYAEPDKKQLQVTAPMEIGDSEIRYISGNGKKTLARIPILVIEPEVSLSAPSEAIAGSMIKLEYDAPGNQGDYITVVSKFAEDGKYGKVSYAKSGSQTIDLLIPMETGEAEIRYMAGANRSVLARTPIEIKQAEITLNTPSEVTVGNLIRVEWTGPANKGDFITLVNQSAADDFYQRPAHVSRGKPTVEILAPMTPGEMEIRYLAGANRATLGRTSITLIKARVGIEPPDSIFTNQTITIDWTGPQNQNDYLTIVPSNTPDNQRGTISLTAQGSPSRINTPAEPGDYEIRYISGQSKEVLGRTGIKVEAQ